MLTEDWRSFTEKPGGKTVQTHCSRSQTVQHCKYLPVRHEWGGNCWFRQSFTVRCDVVGVHRDGRVVVVQDLRGDFIHTGNVWLAASQLSDCCPHVLSIRLAIKLVQSALAAELYSCTYPLSQSSPFLHPGGPHESVLTAEHGFNGRRYIRRVPRRLSDDTDQEDIMHLCKSDRIRPGR